MFSDAAIQFCLNLKCMFGLGLRRATGLAESLIKLARLDWRMPDYSTLSRRQKTLSVAIAASRGSVGLYLLIDSTGVKMLGEGEWKTKKHGVDYCRHWRKVHLGIDAPSRSRATLLAMHRCCRSCWRRFQRASSCVR